MSFQKNNNIVQLQKTANIIRRNIVEMIGIGQKGHY